MAKVKIDFTDRDTKRWVTCLCALVKELESVPEAKKILDKFQVEIIKREEGSNVGLLLPEKYPIPQEWI